MPKAFCVVGSVNMDLVTRVERFPRPGETLRGESFLFFPGGKGANQAVALARLGGQVEMVGAIGNDMLGSGYRDIFTREGVGIEGLKIIAGMATGTASIEVVSGGENHIIIVAGANGAVNKDHVTQSRGIIERASILLLQLEIPLEADIEAAWLAQKAGIPVILDPAPARELPKELLSQVDYLTPNETEAAILSGIDTSTEAGVREAAKSLMSSGVKNIVMKAGKRGAYIVDGEGRLQQSPTMPVTVVDTVAAGDSFNAGLAYALGGGMDIAGAVRFANAVGALSTTKEGAQSAMPSLAEVEALLAANP